MDSVLRSLPDDVVFEICLKLDGSVVRQLNRAFYSAHNRTLKTLRATRPYESISWLPNFSALTHLDLSQRNSVWNVSFTSRIDFSPLAQMTTLTLLDLSFSRIRDLAPIAGLTALTYLDLKFSRIRDLTPITGLTALTHLDIEYDTYIEDVAPLSGLTALKHLDLSHTGVEDVAPLSTLVALKHLDLSYLTITRAAPLPIHALTALTNLDLYGTTITNKDARIVLNRLRLISAERRIRND